MPEPRNRRMLTIMPTLDGRRMPDLMHAAELSSDLADEAIGEVVGDCLRNLAAVGRRVDDTMMTLELKFS